jgi:hypothetical protein
MPTAQEQPQGRDDLLRLVARLQSIEQREPGKEAVAQHLLAKLLPYVDPLAYRPPTAARGGRE